MKNLIAIPFILYFSFGLITGVAQARDERLHFPISDLVESEEAKAKLSGKVKFFFGKQEYGTAEKTYGTFSSNKKTNAFNKSDKEACERALLSALMSLDQRAIREGGNAVVDIFSNYKNKIFTSETEYECGAGTFIGGVALTGKVVQLAE